MTSTATKREQIVLLFARQCPLRGKHANGDENKANTALHAYMEAKATGNRGHMK